jgi:L-asparaginase II
VITASHSADIDQLCLLRQLIDIGDLSEDALRCPDSMPKDQRMRHKFERDGENARPLFHNCSGKHLGYLLSMKAQNIKTENYLDPSGAQHQPLLSVLSQLTGRAIASFVPTVDGCQLPNYSLTAAEAAGMYLGLLNRAMLPSAQVKDSSLIDNLSYIGGLMHDYPDLIDGHGTLDTDIMKGRFFRKGAQMKCVAKFGADGLLAVSLGQSEKYPHGAGILIKLAYGMSASHLEIVFKEVMRQMHLSDDTADNTKQPHLSTKFYFNINEG